MSNPKKESKKMTKKDNDKKDIKSSKKQADEQEKFKRELGLVKLPDGTLIPKHKLIEDLLARLEVARDDGDTSTQVELSKEIIRLQGLTVPKPSVEGEEGELSKENTQKIVEAAIVTQRQLAGLELPQTEPILGDFFNKGDGMFLYGEPGLGKSNFMRYLLTLLSEGKARSSVDKKWLRDRPFKCLLIDCEDPLKQIQDRTRSLLPVSNDNFHLTSFDLILKAAKDLGVVGDDELMKINPDLSQSLWQEVLLKICIDKKIEIVCIDNITAAMGELDENDARDWKTKIAPWLRSFKSNNIAVVLVHHTNKTSVSYRGSSAMAAAPLLIFKVEGATSSNIMCDTSALAENKKAKGDIDSIFIPSGVDYTDLVLICEKSKGSGMRSGERFEFLLLTDPQTGEMKSISKTIPLNEVILKAIEVGADTIQLIHTITQVRTQQELVTPIGSLLANDSIWQTKSGKYRVKK